ncbi:MAG: tetratricopeptide repeat protein, partial [Nitrospinota bacterium]|nr:tetratricopeptide repeat protein [Nitrospinota bacterium]
GLFWFFVTLAPTSSFIPLNELVSEHRIYLPSVGLCIVFASILLASIKKIKSFLIFTRCDFIPEHSVFLLIILFFSLNAVHRNFIWKNNDSIWKDALKKSPLKARPFNEVGLLLFEQKEFGKAEKFLKKTIELNPKYSHTLINLGNLYSLQGRQEEAVLKYKSAIQLKRPDSYYAFIGLGNIYVKKKQMQEALNEYKKAFALDPRHPLAIYNIGKIFELLNKTSEAVTYYQKAVNIDPDFSLALNNLGVIYINETRYNEAITLLKRAIEANREYVEAIGNLGVAYHFMGEIDHIQDILGGNIKESPVSLERGLETMMVIAAAHISNKLDRTV